MNHWKVNVESNWVIAESSKYIVNAKYIVNSKYIVNCKYSTINCRK